MPTQTFLTSGTWTCPTGVTSVQVECWGAGGNGGTFVPAVPDDPSTKTNEFQPSISGYGGGGGAYARTDAVTVVPGTVYTIQVATGGAVNESWFNNSGTVKAVSGSNGAPVSAGAGGLAANCIGVNATAGGNNGSGLSGGTCANGGAGGGDHTNGSAPGGGGGGDDTGGGHGTGANGKVLLTWSDPAPPPPPPDPIVARNQLIMIG